MSTSNNGTDISHNVQIAVDSKNHLVVAVDVVSNPADQTQLYNMASKTIENLGLKEVDIDTKGSEKKFDKDYEEDDNKEILTVLADKGYYSGEELENV